MGPAKPARVSGSLQAAADLNPSVSRRPSPLRVLLYELKSAAAFGKADFMSLYQSDQAALGSEFVARDEIVLQPGESRRYARTLAPETRFIGVLAVYRDLEHATWRAVAPVQPGRAQQILVRADSLAISLRLEP